MKLFLILLGLFTFSLTTTSTFADGCGGEETHSESSDKKKQGSET